MNDISLALMTGIDIPCIELQTVFHQPTLKEISFIGETDFFTGVQCLLINKKLITIQGNFDLDSLSNFHIFMMIMKEEKAKKESVKQVLSLIFPNYSLVFTPQSLILSSDQGQILLDENNFTQFQESVKPFLSPGFKDGTDGTSTFNPQGAKAEEIARKLMRGRERVAAQKNQGSGSVLSQYLSVLTIGISSMSLEDLINLTLFQFFDLMERYMLYSNWDVDMRARMAGATNDKPIENWMKSIH